MNCYHIRTLQRAGSAHRGCQDRYRVLRREDRLILLVSDGHGGRPYTRSGLGARFACAAAEAVLRKETDSDFIPAAIKDRYDAMVAKHLALRPLEDWEAERLGSLPQPAVYGATLLAAVITPTATELFQLGDGEIHALKADGTFFPGLPADGDCQGNLTTSLAHNREFALRHFRTVRYPEPAAGLMLFSDGCEGGVHQSAVGLADLPALDTHLENMLHITNHGDDQTFLLTWNPEIVDTEPFRNTLTEALQVMAEETRRKKQEMRDLEEYTQLRSYLNLAVRKARRLAQRSAPELDAYLTKLKSSYDRYMQLHNTLHPTPES